MALLTSFSSREGPCLSTKILGSNKPTILRATGKRRAGPPAPWGSDSLGRAVLSWGGLCNRLGPAEGLTHKPLCISLRYNQTFRHSAAKNVVTLEKTKLAYQHRQQHQASVVQCNQSDNQAIIKIPNNLSSQKSRGSLFMN